MARRHFRSWGPSGRAASIATKGEDDPFETSADVTATAACEGQPDQRSELGVSKIEIDDQFSANSLRELCNLGKRLLAFGVLHKSCLRLLIGHLVGVLHNDEPVSDIWAGLKATQPIGDPVFEIDGLQLLGQGCHFVDALDLGALGFDGIEPAESSEDPRPMSEKGQELRSTRNDFLDTSA